MRHRLTSRLEVCGYTTRRDGTLFSLSEDWSRPKNSVNIYHAEEGFRHENVWIRPLNSWFEKV
jgi:hypothetical protein